MEQTLSLGCLVMAAGSGRRFGGNKLAAELDGKTLIRRALEAVPGARFSAVTVVSQYEDIEELAGQFGFAAIHNDRPDLGLSHTIRLGTEAMRGLRRHFVYGGRPAEAPAGDGGAPCGGVLPAPGQDRRRGA